MFDKFIRENEFKQQNIMTPTWGSLVKSEWIRLRLSIKRAITYIPYLAERDMN